MKPLLSLAALAVLSSMSTAPAQVAAPFEVRERTDGSIQVEKDGVRETFPSWSAYFRSAFFQAHAMRCGQPELPEPSGPTTRGASTDCNTSRTIPADEYDPGVARYRIPVVVHVLQSTSGSGAISDALIHSQIDILNEDFLALAGTNGAPGTNTEIEFFLATLDPSGQPTNGIDRQVNTTWYNDGGNYAQVLNWDPHRYLNIYTNTASGYLGYAYLPSGGGTVGEYFDGVVCHWAAFGRNAPYGAPYDQGRTATHEVGHYLGLYHTFQGACDNQSCYTDGDRICDTNDESSSNFGCNDGTVSCSSVDPVHNYMDYSDDLCMWEFTPEQARRMRCTVENFRVDLAEVDFSLGAVPVLATTGTVVTLATRGGQPSAPALVFIIDVNDVPFIRAVLNGILNTHGDWTVAGPVPPDPTLPGNVVTLRTFSLDCCGKIVQSSTADVAFQ